MKRYKTSAVMRAIVADASMSGGQRDAASRILGQYFGSARRAVQKRGTFADVFHAYPWSMCAVCGVASPDTARDWPRALRECADVLVALAKRYGIQPTEDA